MAVVRQPTLLCLQNGAEALTHCGRGNGAEATVRFRTAEELDRKLWVPPFLAPGSNYYSSLVQDEHGYETLPTELHSLDSGRSSNVPTSKIHHAESTLVQDNYG
ncbi:unnamed protein product [Calypogeia fissa]